MSWIKVIDRLPPEFQEIIFFYTIDKHKKDMVCGHYARGAWHICSLYMSIVLNDEVKVTHWMPLPEPPND